MHLLICKDLKVSVGTKIVVKDATFYVNENELVLLYGPNASGKTSLAMAILGHPKYKIVNGRIIFDGRDITNMSMEERVKLGLTATFQFSPDLRGITLEELAFEIASRYGMSQDQMFKLIEVLKLHELLKRDVNVGFSGGERKRVELFLTALQKPRFVIFDEPDSGVDPESLALIGRAISEMVKNGLKGGLIITHVGYLAKYINATRAYVMIDGTMICHGDADLISNHIFRYGFKMCIKRFKGEIYELEE